MAAPAPDAFSEADAMVLPLAKLAANLSRLQLPHRLTLGILIRDLGALVATHSR
jgi:hypothetical protein